MFRKKIKTKKNWFFFLNFCEIYFHEFVFFENFREDLFSRTDSFRNFNKDFILQKMAKICKNQSLRKLIPFKILKFWLLVM